MQRSAHTPTFQVPVAPLLPPELLLLPLQHVSRQQAGSGPRERDVRLQTNRDRGRCGLSAAQPGAQPRGRLCRATLPAPSPTASPGLQNRAAQAAPLPRPLLPPLAARGGSGPRHANALLRTVTSWGTLAGFYHWEVTVGRSRVHLLGRSLSVTVATGRGVPRTPGPGPLPPGWQGPCGGISRRLKARSDSGGHEVN